MLGLPVVLKITFISEYDRRFAPRTRFVLLFIELIDRDTFLHAPLISGAFLARYDHFQYLISFYSRCSGASVCSVGVSKARSRGRGHVYNPWSLSRLLIVSFSMFGMQSYVYSIVIRRKLLALWLDSRSQAPCTLLLPFLPSLLPFSFQVDFISQLL